MQSERNQRRAAKREQIAEDRRTAEEERALLIRACSMQSLTELVEAINVPSELIPALMSNRPELVRIAPKRAMTADEVGLLYDIIRVLLETNDALRRHAQEVARQTSNLENGLIAVMTAARKIDALAEFNPDSVEED